MNVLELHSFHSVVSQNVVEQVSVKHVFFNSATTKLVVCARIVAEMGSHPTKRGVRSIYIYYVYVSACILWFVFYIPLTKACFRACYLAQTGVKCREEHSLVVCGITRKTCSVRLKNRDTTHEFDQNPFVTGHFSGFGKFRTETSLTHLV